jgi:hypothetical protein
MRYREKRILHYEPARRRTLVGLVKEAEGEGDNIDGEIEAVIEGDCVDELEDVTLGLIDGEGSIVTVADTLGLSDTEGPMAAAEDDTLGLIDAAAEVGEIAGVPLGLMLGSNVNKRYVRVTGKTVFQNTFLKLLRFKQEGSTTSQKGAAGHSVFLTYNEGTAYRRGIL